MGTRRYTWPRLVKRNPKKTVYLNFVRMQSTTCTHIDYNYVDCKLKSKSLIDTYNVI